ncbi:MAG TPA: hypothetical protein VGR21_02155 [Cryptosporangiaceae bacterium]|nr:hypothetical protein [Cryptosporangiaceae bacterium]
MDTTNETGPVTGRRRAPEPSLDGAVAEEPSPVEVADDEPTDETVTLDALADADEEPSAAEADEPAAAEAAAAQPVRDVQWLVPLGLLIGATFLLGVSLGAANVVGGLLGVAGLVAGVVLALRARAAGSASLFMPVMVGVAAAVMVVAQVLRWL